MQRPIGVTLTAVLQVLGSLLVLSVSIATLLLPAIKHSADTPPVPTPMPLGIYYGFAAIYGIFAALGILTAIGLFRLKNWARYATLVFAPLLAGFALLIAVTIALAPVPKVPGEVKSISPATIAGVKTVMIAIQLGLAALGVFWLYYFSRDATKAAFVPNSAAVIGRGQMSASATEACL